MKDDTISRQAAIDEVDLHIGILYDSPTLVESLKTLVKALPSVDAVPVVRCKECKHNPKLEWFGCPMAGLSAKQRPETAWCWKGERKDGERHE